jgi:hypothetical protein
VQDQVDVLLGGRADMELLMELQEKVAQRLMVALAAMV